MLIIKITIKNKYKTGNIFVHGLICCKNGCGYWNRNVNGASNIYRIAYNAINKKERPNYLSRIKKNSQNQKLHALQ